MSNDIITRNRRLGIPKRDNEKIYGIVALLIFAGLLVGYILWLKSGCELSGVMTWEGKECF